jgi:hypothetical protein
MLSEQITGALNLTVGVHNTLGWTRRAGGKDHNSFSA